MGEITELLQQVESGRSDAGERLFAVLYAELHSLAHAKLRRNEAITLLETTGLVHESYLRLLDARRLAFADRGSFFAFAARVMHSVIVDQIRKRRAGRRGGDAEHVELDDALADKLAADDAEALRVHEALEALAGLDARLAQVVEMRYFAGLADAEIAAALGVTDRTVRRDWDKARALLYAALR